MVKFTDIFIKRPVLACVVSLLLLLVGLRAYQLLPLRQFPRMDTAVIEITTAFPGASAHLMQSYVTNTLQQAVSTSEGIDYVTSRSMQGLSDISIHIKSGFSPDTAFTDIMSKVSSVSGQLPKGCQKPVLQKGNGRGSDLLYLSFHSDSMNSQQITAYLTEVVQPKLESIAGVAQAEIMGGSTYAMRIWLDTPRMNALGVTPGDVVNALQQNNVQSSAGQTTNEYVVTNVQANTTLTNADAFKQLVIRDDNGKPIRLGEVAKVTLGQESYDTSTFFDGKTTVIIGVNSTPTANPLTVIDTVRHRLPTLQVAFPPGLKATVIYDATQYIHASIEEVIKTIFEAVAIVVLVIFLFLGSLRTVLIPVIAIPLSIVGVFSFMLVLGFSINILTLLAIVLAIGMVVDDAIVVVENIVRHIEEGMKPLQAALHGAREMASPIITMSLTLAAVYAPIAFMQGLTGQLFSQFAFTLAGTIILSGVIALTLSPMLCSRVLSVDMQEGRFVQLVDRCYLALRLVYQKRLIAALSYVPVTITLAVAILVSLYFLYAGAFKELAPGEDQSALFMIAQAPQYASLNYMEKYTQQLGSITRSLPEVDHTMFINGVPSANAAIGFIILKPWDQRKRSASTLSRVLNKRFNDVTGLQVFTQSLPPLPGVGGGPPVQFILNTTDSYEKLYAAQEAMALKASQSGLFYFAAGDLKFDKPVISYSIDRNKAAAMGISIQSIANTLSTALGGIDLQRFDMQGHSFKVIPQLSQIYRANPSAIEQLNLRTGSGDLVPLSSVVRVASHVEPSTLNQFQQLNAATIQGVPRMGVTMGQVLHYFKTQAASLPRSISIDYGGQLRQYVEEGNALTLAFIFSLIIIYLVLAAQFESFVDPIIILISVPMSICGALIPLYWGGPMLTINIYTQIGLITLIGLISKHGILIVQFANELQRQGLSKWQAVIASAETRLRPILMTTAAMVFGVIPLIMASGAGAASRRDIGIVIFSGMLIGTLFTLFMVPSLYLLLAKHHTADADREAVTPPDAKVLPHDDDGQ